MATTRKTYRDLAAEHDREPGRRARVEREKALILGAINLQRARERAGLTQIDVARELGISQTRVSAIERAEDLNLSTLQRYVTALGGRLEVLAEVEGEAIPLTPSEGREPVSA